MKLFPVLIASSIFIGSPSVMFAAEESKPATEQNSKQDVAATSTASQAATPVASPAAGAGAAVTTPSASESTATSGNTKYTPGVEISIGADTEDLVPTDDVELAKKQVTAYPDSPEASFILAVALTRTSRVEEALKEVRRARKLAEQKGGTAYFDKMILTYEDLLKNFPNENRVRYGLGWAYYMKAYLLANYSKKVAAWKAANGDPAAALKAANGDPARAIASATRGDAKAPAKEQPKQQLDQAKVAQLSAAVKPGNKGLDMNGILNAVGSLAQGNTSSLPKIPSVTDNVDPADLPQIKKYYEQALQKMDELIAQKPDDVWALVYRAHLRAEYSGNLDEAMATWTQCREKFPNNPAAYFFLGEGYLKQGNLKESLNNVSRAVALRAMGN